MELAFGYAAGLLTLINPCIVPVLPIVLASATSSHRGGPLALAAGLSAAFVILGLAVASVGRGLGLDPETVSNAGAALMILFGVVLVFPGLGGRFELAAAGLSSRASDRLDSVEQRSLTGQFLGGALLGAVWSPCIGPTLGAAVSLASQGENLIWAGAIMTAFSMGVSTMIVGLGYGTSAAIRRHQGTLRAVARKSKTVVGTAFIGVGLMILLKIHHAIEMWAIEVLPPWLLDLSVAL